MEFFKNKWVWVVVGAVVVLWLEIKHKTFSNFLTKSRAVVAPAAAK